MDRKSIGTRWPRRRKTRENVNCGTKLDVTPTSWDSRLVFRRWQSQIWKKWWSMISTKMLMRKIKLLIASQNWNGTWSTQSEHSARYGTSLLPFWLCTHCSSLRSCSSSPKCTRHAIHQSLSSLKIVYSNLGLKITCIKLRWPSIS